MEWLVIIAIVVLLFRTRNRVSELEFQAKNLAETVAQLRARLARESAVAAPPSPYVPPRPVAAPIQPRAVPSPVPISAAASASAGSASAQQGSPTGSGSAGRVPPSFAAPPSGPPPSGPSRPVPPAQPPRPAFDWESLVGVKLFSWIAGAALALAAVFFLRYSMD